VVVVQRFRSDLGLYVHFHCLVTDGAFEARQDEPPVFREMPQLRDEHLVEVLRGVHADIEALQLDEELDIESGLAACVQLGLSIGRGGIPQARCADAQRL
jgi:hypothetical protein